METPEKGFVKGETHEKGVVVKGEIPGKRKHPKKGGEKEETPEKGAAGKTKHPRKHPKRECEKGVGGKRKHPAMVSSVYRLDSAHLQQHPTSNYQAPPDSTTTRDVSANVSDVHRFHVFLQHSLPLSCHCRFALEHRSSSLGNVIEFPSEHSPRIKA